MSNLHDDPRIRRVPSFESRLQQSKLDEREEEIPISRFEMLRGERQLERVREPESDGEEATDQRK